MLPSKFFQPASPFGAWHHFVPKIVTSLREGYGLNDFRADFLAGLTVAIVALPLAMALGIASGATPAQGLITVVVGGLLISLLSGSRYQIGGPAGAFVVIIFNIIDKQGYDGLIIATLMAGVMLLAAGLARLGTWIKYIPQPVVTGFTAGIAVIIFSSQIKDIFGLQIEKVPGEFVEKWLAFWAARDTYNPASIVISFAAVAAIVALKKWAPKLPGLLVAVAGASAVTWFLHLDVPTIGSAFGGIPRALPAPHWPEGITIQRMGELMPSAFTIAFLAGIESLLCAVVADGMTGTRHKSNCELLAQGVANIFSPLFGGMPATGTIARTATNIRAGGRTPLSGVMHALIVFGFMIVFAPLADYIPLAALAAVLVIVAWNMSEIDRIRHLMRAPWGDRIVLITTFVLTVSVDLTVAIQAGVVMAAILFMHRMAQAVEVQTHTSLIEGEGAGGNGDAMRAALPDGVDAYQIRGPFFFGVAARLLDVLDHIQKPPKVFILRMGLVPMIDASGEAALEEFTARCRKHGTTVILSRVQEQPAAVLERMGLLEEEGVLRAADFNAALAMAKKIAEK